MGRAGLSTASRWFLATALLAAGARPALPDDGPRLGPVDEVLRAVRGGDRAALREVAGRHAGRAWALADELAGAGEEDAAGAFAGALPDEAGRALREHLLSRRGRPESASARAAFRVAATDLAAKRWRSVIEILDTPEAAPLEGGILAARTADVRGQAFLGLDRRGDAALEFARAGAAARSLGWTSLALERLADAASLAYEAYLYEVAREAMERLRDLQEATGDLAAVAAADHDLGSIASVLGDYTRATRLFHEALVVFEKGGQALEAARSECDLAAVRHATGDFQGATALFASVERRHAALEKQGKPVPPEDRAEVLSRRAMLEFDRGEDERALELLGRALEGFRLAKDDRGVGLVLGNQGIVRMAQGRFPDALEDLGKAAALFESQGDAHDLGEALVAMAQAHLGRARSLLAGPRGEGATAVARRAKAECEEALARLRAALARQEALGLAAGVAASRAVTGEVLLALGKPEEALAHFEFARDETDRLGTSAPFAESLAWVAKTLAVLGRDVGAVEGARRAVREESRLSFGPTDAYRTRARLAQADASEVGALASARIARSLSRTEAEAAARGDARAAKEAAAERQRRVDDVGYFLEAGRAVALARAMGGRAALRRAAVSAERIEKEEQATRRKSEAFHAYEAARAEGSTRTADLRSAYEAAREDERREFERGAAEEAVAGGRADPPRTESVDEIRRRLAKGDVLALYGVFEDEALALVVPGPGAGDARVVDLGSAAALRALVAMLRVDAEGGPAGLADVAELRKAAVDALGLPAGTRRLLVSPSGALAYVPFSLLVPEGMTVAYEPSGTVLNLLREDQHRTGSDVLALGDPAYDAPGGDPDAYVSRGGARLVPLPASRREVEAVAPGALDVRLLGADATEAGLRAALRKRVDRRWHAVHFACHGLIDVERPTFSSLAVTPGDGEDGFLTVLEVFRENVSTDVAVLSACSTGRGTWVRGEGIVGLARAFMCAGAPRVLVSLWDVDDAATTELMTEFYRRWRPGETGAASALLLAQEHVREFERKGADGKPERPWAAPPYWAAWVLWGLPD
jgi:tetratricopeptide (TPR) repeat protein